MAEYIPELANVPALLRTDDGGFGGNWTRDSCGDVDARSEPVPVRVAHSVVRSHGRAHDSRHTWLHDIWQRHAVDLIAQLWTVTGGQCRQNHLGVRHLVHVSVANFPCVPARRRVHVGHVKRRNAGPGQSDASSPAATENGEIRELQQLSAGADYSDTDTEMSESDDEVQESSVTPVPETTRTHVERRERFVREKVRIVFRLVIVIATAMTAMLAGANFGLFQSLVGSMGASCLAYSAPAFFHVVVFRRQLSFWEKLKDWLIVAFGVVGAIIGTLATLYEFSKVHGLKA